MSAEMRLKKNDVRRRLRGIADRVASPAMMRELGDTAKALITTRTLLGVSASGDRFAPYSTTPMYVSVANRPPGYPRPSGGQPSRTGRSVYFEGGYQQYKAGIGRGAIRNLSVSGEMLGDIQVRAEWGKAILFFGSALSAAKAHGHHTGANNLPESEFFDIGDVTEVAQLNQIAADYIVKQVRLARMAA